MANDPSLWETQRPLEYAQLSREHETLKQKYAEILALHTDVLSALFMRDDGALSKAYTESLKSNKLRTRSDIDNIMKMKASDIPSFLK